ncbi:MAG: LUD domain-containing protein [Acidobacteriaceae bacterium]|nr:LUD domain-containing protein [Acidobacteriaceae bacterium]MBV9497936.1 LUD domain-containing protein [Acidobacteriaceae bacterium]
MTNAKEEIMRRIQNATHGLLERAREYDTISRNYIQSGTRDQAQRIELFCDRLRDYGSAVYTCQSDEITSGIANLLNTRQLSCLLVPSGFPAQWLPREFEFISDHRLTNEQIGRADGVITACALAIASTGTIVLRHSEEAGRRALTLIPDYHLCLVFENQIVETVPEGIRAMSTFSLAPITTISGPSATSDIEMTRIKGVHGPRTLDVLLVGGLNV